MKKKLILLLAAVCTLGLLAGCGEKEKSLRELEVEKYVTLGDYKSITASTTLPEVTDEQLSQGVDSIWQSLLTEETGVTDRAVKEGDYTYISFVGYEDEVAFEGGTGESFLRIGSGSFIPGFEEGLVGVMPGETVSLNLTFPEDYQNADMAGAEVVFEVTVHYIGAEMTDENVALLSEDEYSSAADFKQGVKDYMNSYLEYNYKMKLESEVLEQMVSISTFKNIPDWLGERYESNLKQSLENAAANSGMDVDTFCAYSYGMSAEDYVSTYAGEAVKQGLAFQAIANAEGLNVDDEELNSSLETYIEGTKYATVEEFVGENDIEEYREYFMFEKVLAYLCDIASQNAVK